MNLMEEKFGDRATGSRRIFCILLLTVLVLSGCAYGISAKWRKEANKELTISTVLDNPDAFKGATVIWGGVIYKTSVSPASTGIIIIATPLDRWERPMGRGHVRGRFIARTSRYLDPQIYRAGRRITVAGEIIGQKKSPLNEVEEYIYPVISIRELHLWKLTPHYPSYYWWRWGWYREPGIMDHEGPPDRYEEFWNWD